MFRFYRDVFYWPNIPSENYTQTFCWLIYTCPYMILPFFYVVIFGRFLAVVVCVREGRPSIHFRFTDEGPLLNMVVYLAETASRNYSRWCRNYPWMRLSHCQATTRVSRTQVYGRVGWRHGCRKKALYFFPGVIVCEQLLISNYYSFHWNLPRELCRQLMLMPCSINTGSGCLMTRDCNFSGGS